MAMPSWQQRMLQEKVNAGAINYDDLTTDKKQYIQRPAGMPKAQPQPQANPYADMWQDAPNNTEVNLLNNAGFKRFEASQPGPTGQQQSILDRLKSAVTPEVSFNQFVQKGRPEFVAEHPTLSKVISAVPYGLQTVADMFPQGAQNWSNRVGQTGGEMITMVDNPNKVTTGNWMGDTSADLMGTIAGLMVNPTGGANVGSAVLNTAEAAALKGINKLAPKAPQLARYAGKEAIGGLGYEATRAAANDRQLSAKEGAMSVAGDVALSLLPYGIGKGIELKGRAGNILDSLRAGKADNPYDSLLGGVDETPYNAMPNGVPRFVEKARQRKQNALNPPGMPQFVKDARARKFYANNPTPSDNVLSNLRTNVPSPAPVKPDIDWVTKTKPFAKYAKVVSDDAGTRLVGKNGQSIALEVTTEPKTFSSWNPNQKKITLRHDSATGEFEFDHELSHAMRDLGMITDTEWTHLTTLAQKDISVNQVISDYALQGKHLEGDDLAHEVVARAVQKWRKDGIPGEAKGLVEKILQFLHDVGRTLGVSETKATDVARDVLKGKPLARSAGNQTATARLAVTRHAVPESKLGSTQLDQIKKWVTAGARSSAQDFTAWKQEMLKQFPELTKFKESEALLKVLFKNSTELKNGSTVIKFGGQSLRLKGKKAKGNAVGLEIVEKPMTGKLDLSPANVMDSLRATAGSAKKILPGQKERGVSKNLATDKARPAAMQQDFLDNPAGYDPLSNKKTLARAQAVFNPADIEGTITEMNRLLNDFKPEAAPLAKMVGDHLYSIGQGERARALLSDAAAKATEAGQFGQAWHILRESDPATLITTIEKQIKKLNRDGLKTYGTKWNEIGLIPDELDAIGKVKPGDKEAYQALTEQIQKRIADILPAGSWEKLNAWRHIAMLLNPKTQVRNVIGNGIMLVMRRNAKKLSAVLQKTLPAEQRTQVWKVKNEYKQIAENYFEANKKELLGGPNKYNETITLNMPDKRVFGTNALEGARKLTYKLLEMGDTPFFKNAYVDRLASYAQAKGIKDLTELPEEAFETALKEAMEATYKDTNRVAQAIAKWKNPGPDAGLGAKVGAFATEAVMPFTKTPLNIVSRGIEYSPAGVINGIYKLAKKQDAAEAIDVLAKGMTGTGIVALGYMLSRLGVLTGKSETDADLKAYNANTGKSPFSVWGQYTYDWAQPFAIPLSVGVEIFNALDKNPQELKAMDEAAMAGDNQTMLQVVETMAQGLVDALYASGDTVFNMSVLKGLKYMLNGQGFMQGVAELPMDYAGQFVPTIGGQAAGAIDQTVRNTYVKGAPMESFFNQQLNKIPFASKTLPAKQTPFGQDVQRIDNPAARTMAQFFSPGNVNLPQNVDPVIDAELRRLADLGYKEQMPTMVNNYIEGDTSKDRPKVPLNADQTVQYQKLVGQETERKFKELMASSEYARPKKKTDAQKKKTDDELRAALLAKAIQEAKAEAKKTMLKNMGYNASSI